MKTLFISLLALYPLLTIQAAPWPAWRGDLEGSGKTAETDVPLEWGTEKNVAWRVELPERGNSTPVVWGGRVFLTQAIEEENFRGLMCFNRNDGELLWKNGLTYTKEERTHRSNPYASASPATDGEMVVAAYGSAGLAAYDFEGNELWRRDLGAIDHVWGSSSSPLLYGNLVIHYHGPGDGGFLIALDKNSGETVWKYDEPDWEPEDRTDGFQGRDDEGVIGSFSTPILIENDGRDELIMSFPMEIVAFDPKTGEKLWETDGLNPLVYTSPVFHDGVVIAMGGYHGNSVAARSGGERLWQKVRHNGGIGTGVMKDGYYYYQNSGGIAYCLNVETGETMWEERLPGAGKSWGSFVLAGDRIYSLSQAGDTVVFKANPEGLKVLAENDIGEHTNSSLAISDGQIFIRTWEALWCIEE